MTTATRRILQSTSRATPLPVTPLPVTPLPVTPLPVGVGGAFARQFSASARNAGFLRGKPGGFSRDPFHKTLLTQRQQVIVVTAACFSLFFFNDYLIPDHPKPGTFLHWATVARPSRTTKWYPDKQQEEMEEEMD